MQAYEFGGQNERKIKINIQKDFLIIFVLFLAVYIKSIPSQPRLPGISFWKAMLDLHAY